MSEEETLIKNEDTGLWSTDYRLSDGANSAWITVGTLSVYIYKTDEGVSVDIYPRYEGDGEALASCWALFADGNTEPPEN